MSLCKLIIITKKGPFTANHTSTCNAPPSLDRIQLSNDNYQLFWHEGVDLWLYSAHVDKRRTEPMVRVLFSATTEIDKLRRAVRFISAVN